METLGVRESKHNGDFRVYLQNELIRRTKANPKYSLRAFARFLGIQPDFLSKILRGQRSVTSKTVHKLGLKLGLGPDEIEKYQARISSKSKRAESVGGGARSALDYKTLVFDHYQVISDWHHFAMLELARVRGFNPDPKWIARTLGITVTEVHAAIARLERLEFLEIGDDGRWKILDSGNTTTIGTEITAAALRKMQKQILLMAEKAVDDIAPEKRDQTSMTMAIDSSLLPEAKERVTRFRRELCSFLENGPCRDQVYQLSISLFPVTDIPRIQASKTQVSRRKS